MNLATNFNFATYFNYLLSIEPPPLEPLPEPPSFSQRFFKPIPMLLTAGMVTLDSFLKFAFYHFWFLQKMKILSSICYSSNLKVILNPLIFIFLVQISAYQTVLIGCGTTMFVLAKGLGAMRAGNMAAQQKYMRYRIMAQAATIFMALVAVQYTAGRRLKPHLPASALEAQQNTQQVRDASK